MATHNTASTINAWLKEIYADSIQSLIPEGVKLIKAVKYNVGEEIGDKYVQPVTLTHEFGFSVGEGAFDLNDSVAAQYKEAQVEGKNLLLRTAVSYDAAARASSTKKAFMKWSDQIIGNMTSSFTKRLEILHFYGSTSLAAVSAADDDAAGENTVTLTTASFASGIWAGSEGMQLDAYSTGGTKRNTTGALTVASVDLNARTVTLTGAAADCTATVATDTLHFRSFYGSEMNGLDKIVTNTGTLYNISAASYALWKGNSYAAAGALTFAKIQQAVSLGVVKGLDEKVTVYCSPKTYADLNTDLAAARSFDSSFRAKKAENGAEAISFYSVNGEIEIVPSIYVKEGEAFCVPLKRLKRIGATDVTMRMPGMSDEELMTQLPSKAGYEMRLFYDGNLFCERPAHAVKITGIVNSN